MAWIRITPALAILALAAGCGGTTAAPPPAPPGLEPRVAAPLANRADSVAAALERGDGCTARSEAAKLQQQAIGAVNTGDVPPALQEELTAAVNRVAARIECVPPPPVQVVPAQVEQQQVERRKHWKKQQKSWKKNRGRHRDDDEGDE
jgi:hypothetical protein